ncbi:MAG: hypothetical protein WB808_11175 [Candidatus Dormiibacterota bacterium]
MSVVLVSRAAGAILALAPFAAIDNTERTWRWAPEGDWFGWGLTMSVDIRRRRQRLQALATYGFIVVAIAVAVIIVQVGGHAVAHLFNGVSQGLVAP